MTRIVSKPALCGTLGLGLRSNEEADPSPAGRGGTGVVDRDGVALSLSDPNNDFQLAAHCNIKRRFVTFTTTEPARHVPDDL